MKKRSLKFKLMISGILIVLVPLVITGFFSVTKSSQALLNLGKSNIELTAKTLATTVDLVLSEEIKLVNTLAADPVTRSAAEAYSNRGPDGAAAEIELLGRKLQATMKKVGSDYEGLFLTNTKGIIIADGVGGKQKGIDLSTRAYFKKAMAGKEAVSDPVKSKLSGNLIAPVAVPVFSASGEVVGTVAAVLDINFLVAKITSIKIGESGYPVITNDAGLTVVHPNKDLILKVDVSKLPEMAPLYNGFKSKAFGTSDYVFKGVDKTAGFAACQVVNWHVLAIQDQAELSAASHTIRKVILLVGAAFLVLTILGVLFFAGSISKPINRIVALLNAGSDEVASASGQVSGASQSLAEGASEQAAAIEETSSSLEEMASMTRQNADNAGQADQLMRGANDIVGQASREMEELTTSMGEISKASEETQKIVKTIDEIAFQTNLLALNAAVEAARAGEAGAGFAVVADEVRNLAIRAAEAAKTTSDLIQSTSGRIQNGAGLVETTNKAFREIAEASGKVSDLVAEIAAASKEQAQGVEQINNAISEMDKVVQNNAATAEESASASEEMNAQAEQLKAIVEQLATIISGSQQARPVVAASASGRPVRPANGKKAGHASSAPEAMIPFDDGHDDAFGDF